MHPVPVWGQPRSTNRCWTVLRWPAWGAMSMLGTTAHRFLDDTLRSQIAFANKYFNSRHLAVGWLHLPQSVSESIVMRSRPMSGSRWTVSKQESVSLSLKNEMIYWLRRRWHLADWRSLEYYSACYKMRSLKWFPVNKTNPFRSRCYIPKTRDTKTGITTLATRKVLSPRARLTARRSVMPLSHRH